MLDRGVILKDQYKIMDIAGRGGQGSVYRAIDLKRSYFERGEVAIKEMRRGRDILSSIVNMDFFRQEVMILSKLRHPYLPRIFDIFTQEGNLYIVEEFIEGKTLEEVIRTGGKMKPVKAVEIALRVADILDFLHQQKPPVYYRDLKPANLLMQPGRLYLVDFSGCYIPLTGIGEGVAIRTRGYCPPEAYKTSTADPAFDVYTLGMLLYRMVTGIDVGEFAGPAPPLVPKRDRLPSPLVAVINKAISKNKFSRYHTIWEMKLEMEKLDEQLRNAIEEKVPEGDLPKPPKIPVKYKIYDIAKSIALPVMDFLVFALLPLMFFRQSLSQFIPFAQHKSGLPWGFYFLYLFIIIIYLAYRHFLDWIDTVGLYNRFLFFPIRNWLDIRPIRWLLILEVIFLIYIYYSFIFY